MTELGEAALRYAARGWQVFPVTERGKLPKIKAAHQGGDCRGACGRDGHGLYDASLDSERIAGWWTRWPSANIGVRTGVCFDALDLDGPQGRASINTFCDQHGVWLPGGPWAITGGDGDHLLFRPTGLGNRAGVLPGVDWRGRGGYVVVAPSIHPSGRPYVWMTALVAASEGIPNDTAPFDLDTALEPVPGWLADLLRPRAAHLAPRSSPMGRTTPYGGRALESECGLVALAATGARNHALNRAAFALGQLIASGQLDEVEAVTALATAAQRAGLGGREIERTIASGLTSGMKHPRQVPA